MKKIQAVVIELGIGGLSIVRSLGAKDIPIIGIDNNKAHYGTYSKYITNFINSAIDDRLIELLLGIGRTLPNKSVLFPTSDYVVELISKNRKVLEKYYYINIPNHYMLSTFLKKEPFYKYSISKNLPIPLTYFSKSKNDLVNISNEISFPIVVKPNFRDPQWESMVPHQKKVMFVKNADSLKAIIDQYRIGECELILQEWIDGNDDQIYFCQFYINNNQKPLGIFSGKTVSLYPPLTGLYKIALSESLPELIEKSIAIFREAEIYGLCSLEYKYSNKEQKYYITEPTVGRIDMQTSMAMSCGVNLPYIAYQDAINEEPRIIRKNNIENNIWICENLVFKELKVKRILKMQKVYKNILSHIYSYRFRRPFAIYQTSDVKPFLYFLKKLILNL